MLLTSGVYCKVSRAGTRAGYPAHTLHLVRFWQSKADCDAGKPAAHVQDFETQWNGQHPDPGSKMVRIIERYVQTHDLSKPAGLLADEHWSDAPDTHGNLMNPSMEQFKAATQ
jgi:hypothetical protein